MDPGHFDGVPDPRSFMEKKDLDPRSFKEKRIWTLLEAILNVSTFLYSLSNIFIKAVSKKDLIT